MILSFNIMPTQRRYLEYLVVLEADTSDLWLIYGSWIGRVSTFFNIKSDANSLFFNMLDRLPSSLAYPKQPEIASAACDSLIAIGGKAN